MPLEALRRCDPRPSQVIVVDNGSSDGLSEYVEENFPEVSVIRADRNLGFAGGNNLGIINASGEVVVLLNDDTEPEKDWLGPLEKAFQVDRRLGIAGCQLLYPDSGKIQHLGAVVHPNGLTDHIAWGEKPQSEGDLAVSCPYVTGAAIAIRRSVFQKIGLLDDGFFPIYYEEVDFCERAARAGFEIAVVPGSRVVHHESQTTNRMSQRFLRLYHRNRIRYLLKNRRIRGLARAMASEARWIVGHTPWDQFWPLALAYAWAPFHASDVFRHHRRRRGSSW